MKAWVTWQVHQQSGLRLGYESIEGWPWAITVKNVVIESGDPKGFIQKFNAEVVSTDVDYAKLATFSLGLNSVVVERGGIEVFMPAEASGKTELPCSINTVALKEFDVTVKNLGGGWTFAMMDSNLSLNLVTLEEFDGTLDTPKASMEKLEFTDISTGFALKPGQLHVSGFKANLEGAPMTLDAEALYGVGELKNAAINIKGADIQTLLTKTGFSDKFAGKVDIDLKGNGVFAPEEKNFFAKGTGMVSKVSPTVSIPNLPIIGNSELIQDAKNLRDLSGPVEFEVKGSKIHLHKLDIKSPEGYGISGSGSVDLNKELDVPVTFKVPKALEAKIPSVAAGAFDKNEAGDSTVPVTLTGTTLAPKIKVGSAFTKALMNPVEPLKSLNPLKGLFGGGDKKEEGAAPAAPVSP